MQESKGTDAFYLPQHQRHCGQGYIPDHRSYEKNNYIIISLDSKISEVSKWYISKLWCCIALLNMQWTVLALQNKMAALMWGLCTTSY